MYFGKFPVRLARGILLLFEFQKEKGILYSVAICFINIYVFLRMSHLKSSVRKTTKSGKFEGGMWPDYCVEDKIASHYNALYLIPYFGYFTNFNFFLCDW